MFLIMLDGFAGDSLLFASGEYSTYDFDGERETKVSLILTTEYCFLTVEFLTYTCLGAHLTGVTFP